MRKGLFSKFKDYNYILDQLLEKKHFQEDSKNLLLSMFYKIETSYDDYSKVKMSNISKNDFFDLLINDIDEYCNKIYLLDPKDAEIQNLKKKNTIALTKEREKTIYAYPTEIAILYGIADIKPKYFFISNRYDFIKVSFQKILVEGSNLNKTEIIRNFNGWSWDYEGDRNINCIANLVYQELVIIFGEAFLRRWEFDSSPKKDYIWEMKKRLQEGYDEKIMKEFYISLMKLLFFISPQKELYRKKYGQILKMYDEMKNKSEYILKISKEKIRLEKQIEKISIVLENQDLLVKEFKKQSIDDDKFFSMSAFADDLSEKRDEKIHRIKQLTDLEKVSNYQMTISELKEKIEIMSILDDEKSLTDYIKDFEKVFLKCIDMEIDEISEREEYIELLYKLRYMKRLYINNNEKVEDIKGINTSIVKLMKKLVTVGCQNKIFNVFSKDVDLNYKIIGKVVDSQIINFEDIDISLKKEDDKLAIYIYDNDVLEKKEFIPFDFPKSSIKVRFKKQISLYVF